MAANGEVNLILNAKGNALAVLKTLQSQVSNFQTTFRAGFNLNLGAQAANFLLAIPGQIANLGKEAVALAGKLKDQSEALGVSTTALQVYRTALDNAGGTAEQFDKAVASSNRALLEARANSGSVAEAFRLLGLNTDKLARLPIEQRFDAIAKAVANSKDPVAAFSAAGQILGSKGLPTLLNALRDVSGKGFDELSKSMERAGLIMGEDTIQRLDAAEKALKRFRNAAVIGVGEAISFGDKLIDSFKVNPKDTIFGLLAAVTPGLNGGAGVLTAIVNANTKKPPAASTTNGGIAADPLATRENIVRAQLAALEQQRTRLEADVGNTEIEKKDAVITLLDQQVKLYEELKRLRVGDVKLSDDESTLTEAQLNLLKEKRDIEAKITDARIEQAELGGVVQGRAFLARQSAGGVEDSRTNSNFVANRDSASVGVNDFITQAGSTGEQVAATITDTLGSAVQSISDGIYGWITGLNTFADVARSLGLSVLQETLDTVVKIGVQQVLNGNAAKAIAVGWKALTSSLRAAETGEVIAAEAAKAPALATNAATASAGSFGISAVVGIALLAGLLGAFLAGFEDGGYTGAGASSAPAGIVHKGEYVLTQAEVNRLGIGRIENFKNLRGYESGGLVSALGSSARATAGGSGRAQMTVFVDSDRSANRIARNTQAEVQIIDLSKANKYEIFG